MEKASAEEKKQRSLVSLANRKRKLQQSRQKVEPKLPILLLSRRRVRVEAIVRWRKVGLRRVAVRGIRVTRVRRILQVKMMKRSRSGRGSRKE